MHNQVIVERPDTVLGVLEQFGTSKEQITLFASKVINEVEAGNVDALKVKVLCKTLTEIADKIDKGTKENQLTEVAKYGERPFQFMGAELHYTPTYTSYDYTACNDTIWQSLEAQITELKAQQKKREEWLKTMGGTERILDEATGELVTIHPPIKKSTMGIKTTIK